ncbi:B-cell antigen receptor complex-associated protein alpha chain [Acanthochromis polyacanthus]|uniref:CD79a molecule, immunoglobulin-associated alpha n=1 Tax=Acanthochromis polyacanthus TaxID=80966 RepID=A0A3Q1F9A4_9TELE|nr:B-cell antigen receptor complex-associated protein alpha chain [Acanthochromis polyacanthus]
MRIAVIVVLCSLAGITQGEVTLKADRPYLEVRHPSSAELKCCYKGAPQDLIWIRRVKPTRHTTAVETVIASKSVREGDPDVCCGTLKVTLVQLNDSGLYQCYLNDTKLFTHGTYLHVYEPLDKTIDFDESTKNTILTVEGILLLMCVLVPSAILLFKSKTLHTLEKKKMKKEEENIYQGLNLDDCCTTYDQIERSQAQGPYQDVANILGEGDEVQLEKP